MDYDAEKLKQAQVDMEFRHQLAVAQFEQAKALRREEFAKAALPGLFNAPGVCIHVEDIDASKIARIAFEIADAMVAAADKKGL